jgi:hypothetical protein
MAAALPKRSNSRTLMLILLKPILHSRIYLLMTHHWLTRFYNPSMSPGFPTDFIYYVMQRHMMKKNFVIGIVVAIAVGVVVTGSTLPAISAQGNMTAGGGGNMTAGGGDIVQQLKSAAVAAELIDNKKMFIIACEPSMTDPDTQCVVANLQMR